MEIPLAPLMALVGDFLWNFLRVGAFFLAVPVFGNQLVPARVRLLLSFAVALALTPVLPAPVALADFGMGHIVQLAVQMGWSIGLGFSAAIFFQLFVIAGQFIGMQMGLGFAAMVDPGNGIQVTVWSQFFLMLVTLSFLTVNGHLILLEILIEGYQLGVTTAGGLTGFAYNVAALGGWMFVGGVLIAIPAVVSLLIVNLAFGIMNRSAPQLNIFALGFPFSLIFGLIIIWILLHGWTDQFTRLLGDYFDLTTSAWRQ